MTNLTRILKRPPSLPGILHMWLIPKWSMKNAEGDFKVQHPNWVQQDYATQLALVAEPNLLLNVRGHARGLPNTTLGSADRVQQPKILRLRKLFLISFFFDLSKLQPHKILSITNYDELKMARSQSFNQQKIILKVWISQSDVNYPRAKAISCWQIQFGSVRLS